MKLFRFLIGLVLVALPTAYAFAWPDQPPDAAFVSNPNLNGEVAITDVALLKLLCLGCVEDFSTSVPEPESQVRYTIHRHFYDDTFDFGVLTYVPANGGYVRFDDGPDLVGTPTVFNGQWYRVKPEAQIQLSQFIATLESTTPAQSSSTSAPLMAASPWIWVGVLAIVLGLSVWLVRRKPVQVPTE